MAFKTKYPELVTLAQKKFKNVGAVVSIFDIFWMCEKATRQLGYTQKEMENKKLKEFLVTLDEKGFTHLVMSFFFGEGRRHTAVVTGKGGKSSMARETVTPYISRERFML